MQNYLWFSACRNFCSFIVFLRTVKICYPPPVDYSYTAVFQYVIKALVLMFLENHSNQRETQRNNPHYKCGCSYSFF